MSQVGEKHGFDEIVNNDVDNTMRKRPRVWKLPVHWWLYLTRQYQDGLFGRDAGFDYHVLSQFQFDDASPRRWYTREKPWSGITLDDNTGRNVTEIVLTLSQLKTIPESINKLNSLTYLEMGHNYLVKLPNSIGDLHSLTQLYIENNCLIYLPDSIGDLYKLIVLNISNNRLQQIPESIGNLTSLEILELQHNCLIYLPDSIGDLYKLIVLNISNNFLTTLPESINKLKSLECLYGENNMLLQLPESIIDLCHSLGVIHLENNQNVYLSDSKINFY